MNYISVMISCVLIIGIGLLATGNGYWAGVLSVVPIKMLTATWIVGASDGQLAEMSWGMIIGSVASMLFAITVLFVVKNDGNYWYAMVAGMGVWTSVIVIGKMGG